VASIPPTFKNFINDGVNWGYKNQLIKVGDKVFEKSTNANTNKLK
jgi:hypothetical protein